jgi:hypothetical protein
LSRDSRKNFIKKIDSIPENVFNPNYLLTLTYPKEFPHDGVTVKRDLQALYGAIVGKFGYIIEHDSNFKMVWKMEFQKRGSPHFHCLVQSSLEWRTLLDVLLRYWKRLTHNDQDVCVDLQNVRDKFAVEVYISLHFSKDSQNKVPSDFVKPGRFWGMMGLRAPKAEIVEHEELPAFATRHFVAMQQIRASSNPFFSKGIRYFETSSTEESVTDYLIKQESFALFRQNPHYHQYYCVDIYKNHNRSRIYCTKSESLVKTRYGRGKLTEIS